MSPHAGPTYTSKDQSQQSEKGNEEERTFANRGTNPLHHPCIPSSFTIAIRSGNVRVEAAETGAEEVETSACRRVLITSKGLVRVAAICGGGEESEGRGMWRGRIGRGKWQDEEEGRARGRGRGKGEETHHSASGSTHECHTKLAHPQPIR